MSVYGLLLIASNLSMADMARLHTYIRPLEGTDKLTTAERQLQDEKIRFAVQTPPISSGDYSTRGLALLSLQLEFP